MITSTSSSQVKHVVNLQKKAKLRKEEKQFVVIGVLTYFYKLDSIRTTMTDELDNRRKNLNLMESGCGEIA